jgi:hypothetical protein
MREMHNMRVHDLRSRALRALAVAGILAATMSVGITSSSAAAILPTTTTVVSSSNPALEGTQVTATATVKILGTNLGPITPKGTVTFSLDGVPVATAPVSSCVVLLTPCTASATFTAPDVDWADSFSLTARYNGDSLAKPSTGTLEQEVVAPRGCSADFSCYHSVDAADGTARLEVSTGGGASGPYTIAIWFTTKPLSCTTAGTGDTAVFDVTAAIYKWVQLTTYDAAATTANQNPNRICWGSDQPFQTASGVPAAFNAAAGEYQGLLPMCSDGGPEPCVDGPSQYSPPQGSGCDCDPRARLETWIVAPPGDPKATR